MAAALMRYRCAICGHQDDFPAVGKKNADGKIELVARPTISCPSCEHDTMMMDPMEHKRTLTVKCRICLTRFEVDLEPGKDDDSVVCPCCNQMSCEEDEDGETHIHL